jgi:hypothetical protein
MHRRGLPQSALRQGHVQAALQAEAAPGGPALLGGRLQAPGSGRGLCSGQGKDPTRPIRVLRAKTGERVLAWGRLPVDRSFLPVLKAHG